MYNNNVLQLRQDISETLFASHARRACFFNYILTKNLLTSSQVNIKSLYENGIQADALAIGANQISNRLYTWEEKIYEQQFDTVSAAVGAAATSIVGTAAASGNTNFSIGDLVYVENNTPVSDETLQITAVAVAAGVATYTVTRAIAGTAIALIAGARLRRVPAGILEGSIYNAAQALNFTTAQARNNLTQIFRQDIAVSNNEMTALYYAMGRANGNQELAKAVSAETEAKYGMTFNSITAERLFNAINTQYYNMAAAFLYGVRQVETATVGQRMDGLFRLIAGGAGVPSRPGLITNLAAGAITQANLMAHILSAVERGMDNPMIVASPSMVNKITALYPSTQVVRTDFLAPGAQQIPGSDEILYAVGGGVQSISLTVPGLVNPIRVLADFNMRPNTIYVGDPEALSIKSNRLNEQGDPALCLLMDGAKDGYDGVRMSAVSEITLCAQNIETSQSLIINIA
jgi:hypothetical protein